MKIELSRADKVTLLKALQVGYLETDDLQGLTSQNLKIEVVQAKEEIARLEELAAQLAKCGYVEE